MPSSWQKRCTSAVVSKVSPYARALNSIWFTAGRYLNPFSHMLFSRKYLRCTTLKLDTPRLRTFPSAFNSSSAFQVSAQQGR